MTLLLSVLVVSAMFVVFGALAIADRGSGCHDCSHASECSGVCDLVSKGESS